MDCTTRSMTKGTMIKLFFIILSLIIPFNSFAGEKWSKTDIALETTWQILHVMDWRQTVQIARNPNQYWERNPLLGGHPSEQKVNLHFLVGTVLHPIVTEVLPSKYRLWGIEWKPRIIWESISIGMSGTCILNNFSIGLGIKF